MSSFIIIVLVAGFLSFMLTSQFVDALGEMELLAKRFKPIVFIVMAVMITLAFVTVHISPGPPIVKAQPSLQGDLR